MTKEKLIQAYMENSLTADQQEALEGMITEGKIQLEELESNDLFGAMEDELTVSQEADYRFQKLIETAPEQVSTSPAKQAINWYKYGLIGLASLVLLFAVYSLGKQSNALNPAMNPVIKQDFASQFIEAEDASEKITLVSTETLDLTEDKKITEALLSALNTDKSTNVRIACVQTLERYSYMEEVRSGLVNSIIHQTSPLVLSHIADAINASGKGLSKSEMEKRINKNLPQPILDNIEANFLKI